MATFVGKLFDYGLRKRNLCIFCSFQERLNECFSGRKCKKGQLIGKVGYSGNSTAPHLHFHLIFEVGGYSYLIINDSLIFIDEFRYGYPDAFIEKKGDFWVLKTKTAQLTLHY